MTEKNANADQEIAAAVADGMPDLESSTDIGPALAGETAQTNEANIEEAIQRNDEAN